MEAKECLDIDSDKLNQITRDSYEVKDLLRGGVGFFISYLLCDLSEKFQIERDNVRHFLGHNR